MTEISLIVTLNNQFNSTQLRYWLTDAEGGGQPIPDKVFMVMSRPKSKSIIALLNDREFTFTKIEISIVTAFYRAR